MDIFMFSFFASFATVCIILLTEDKHAHLSHDKQSQGIQKIHTRPTPRIGGIAIMVGLIAGSTYLHQQQLFTTENSLYILIAWGISSLPVFFAGITEDITKIISPKIRLLAAFLSATLAYFLIQQSGLTHIGWEWFDNTILAIPVISLLLTIFMIGGVSHATNIIDGANGLLLGFAIIAIGVMGWIAHQEGDLLLVQSAMLISGSLLGLILFNFPHGRIFTGDGGAYLIGFVLATYSLMLVERNENVSPWLPLLVLIHPVFETLFSIFRRKFIQKIPSDQADQNHFHSLIFQHLNKIFNKKSHSNPMTSVIIWIFTLSGPVLIALYSWEKHWIIISGIIYFCSIYSYVYFKILSKNIPKKQNLDNKQVL